MFVAPNPNITIMGGPSSDWEKNFLRSTSKLLRNKIRINKIKKIFNVG